MEQDAKVLYDRQSNDNHRTNHNKSFPMYDSKGKIIEELSRVFGDRVKLRV